MPDDSLIQNLTTALAKFDWPQCEKLCAQLVANLNSTAAPYPEAGAKQILSLLRRKRQFGLVATVAEAIIRSGQASPPVVRLYAQAMIDQGNLTASEKMLISIVQDYYAGEDEKAEAKGLLGRIYKQLYVNANAPSNPRQQSNLRQAVQFYYDVYRTDKQSHLWHGINAVALLARADRDNIKLGQFPSSSEMAEQVFCSLHEKSANLEYWDRATAAESALALGNWTDANKEILLFLGDPNVDAFEVASLLRQLTEVWGLTPDKAPGDTIIATLKAGLLKRQGGHIEVKTASAPTEANNAGEAKVRLEKVFGADRYAPLEWYKTGLQRCSAVGRVETVVGQRVGTGFLVRASDFFPRRDDKEFLFLTNSHVISPPETPYRGAVPWEAARVVFEAAGKTCKITGWLWSSPPTELDATFVTLEPLNDPEICPLNPPAAAFDRSKQQRVYVIGYPMGGGLSISLQDSVWLDADDRLLRYRTPTDPGSSGSPVFDQDYWTVVAIHHAGEKDMQRLDGQPGTYDANEGISIIAIQNATKSTAPKVATASE